MSRLGIDVDGCLANFCKGYAELLKDVDGDDKLPADYKEAGWKPPTWYWDEYYGYSSEVSKECWRRIKADPIFWFKLAPLAGAGEFLAKLNEAPGLDAVYFITDRPGVATQLQTQLWLGEQGYSGPNVIVSGKKGDLCQILGIDYYIDDKRENVEDVRAKSPDTVVYTLTTPYNEEFTLPNRLSNLEEFAELIGLNAPREE